MYYIIFDTSDLYGSYSMIMENMEVILKECELFQRPKLSRYKICPQPGEHITEEHCQMK